MHSPKTAENSAALAAVDELAAASGSAPEASGMAEMEQLVHQSQAAPGQPSAAPSQPSAPAEAAQRFNWSTHKNEGMRLRRMMDSNSERFPHMAKLWEGTNKDRNGKKQILFFFKINFQ